MLNRKGFYLISKKKINFNQREKSNSLIYKRHTSVIEKANLKGETKKYQTNGKMETGKMEIKTKRTGYSGISKVKSNSQSKKT